MHVSANVAQEPKMHDEYLQTKRIPFVPIGSNNQRWMMREPSVHGRRHSPFGRDRMPHSSSYLIGIPSRDRMRSMDFFKAAQIRRRNPYY